MAPLMLTLFEQLLAQKSFGQLPLGGTLLERAANVHINQFEAELQVGGDGKNSNCGPTLLVMALHALGLRVSGESAYMSPGEVVDLARRSMVTDPGKDGVDSRGGRADEEHSTYNNFDELMRGARAAGARASRLSSDVNNIRDAVLTGSKVIVSGTFSKKSPLPWTGDRGHDNQSAPGGATKHIIAVTGYDQASGMFIINDPACRTPIAVSSDALESFMQGNAGALEISRF